MIDDHPACALDRLKDESGDGGRILKQDLIFHGLSHQLRQFCRIAFVKRVAITIGRGQVITARQQRLIGRAEPRVSIDRGAAKMRAVIAFLEAEKFDPLWLAA